MRRCAAAPPFGAGWARTDIDTDYDRAIAFVKKEQRRFVSKTGGDDNELGQQYIVGVGPNPQACIFPDQPLDLCPHLVQFSLQSSVLGFKSGKFVLHAGSSLLRPLTMPSLALGIA